MAFITVEGENKIALQQGNAQLLAVDSFVLANIDGLGAEPADRIETMPAGGDIVADLPVTRSGYVNTNQVVYSLVMDSTLGPFDFNWVGLVDADGVVIAVVYVPLTSKTATVGEVPGNNLTRNFLLAFSDIQATTAIAVPAETWQIDFTARLLAIDERERLSNFDIYGLAAFFGNGWQVVRQGATTTYDVKAGIGYVGGIRADNAADQQFTDGGPAGVWLDVSLEGDISDVSAVVAILVDGAAHPDYTDSNGFDHYLTRIADVAANGDVTDLRVNADWMTDHLAQEDPHGQYLLEPIRLDETDDLDDVIEPGLYDWGGITVQPANVPAPQCAMIVQKTNYPQQLVWGGAAHVLLVRRQTGGTWSAWTQYQTVLPTLDEYPQIQTSDNKLMITPGLGEVVIDAAQLFVRRGLIGYSTDDYDLDARSLPHVANKTYHVRWSDGSGFEIKDLADPGYNPPTLAETDPAFDSTYDDMLVARVVTDGGNAATVTRLANARRLAATAAVDLTALSASGWTALAGSDLALNWARSAATVDASLRGSKSNNEVIGAPVGGTAAILQFAVRPAADGSRYSESLEYVYEDFDENHGRLFYQHRVEA